MGKVPGGNGIIAPSAILKKPGGPRIFVMVSSRMHVSNYSLTVEPADDKE
jgi:hypothetical protein